MESREIVQAALVFSLILQVFGCEEFEKRCPNDGRCIAKTQLCDGEVKKCQPGLKTCPDGRCVLTFMHCDPVECDMGMKQCASGECVALYTICPSTTEDNCPKRCVDGRCTTSDSYCVEELCPYWRNHRCDDGDCFSTAELCNGSPDCADGSDEKDCENQPRNNTSRSESITGLDIVRVIAGWPWWVYVIAGVVFVLFCLIIALCCRYQRRQARRERVRKEEQVRRRLRQLQEQQTALTQPAYSHEMPVVAGRRQQPIPGSYQPVPTEPPHQQGRASAPSPFNPAYTSPHVFPQCNTAFPQCNTPGQQPSGQSRPLAEGGTPHTGEYQVPMPSAPPIGMEAPPPYSEAVGDPYPPPQPGNRGPHYLPSYQTVLRGDP